MDRVSKLKTPDRDPLFKYPNQMINKNEVVSPNPILSKKKFYLSFEQNNDHKKLNQKLMKHNKSV